ncbi:methionine--tRNA ligase [Candidatus Pacearchaeota archaeon]|nr:methionine--tRNA ligase [Candidatus Pacearchaeota archaeon]
MTKTFYITTAIDYVNSRPHVGHAYEKVLADAIARWNRLNKKDVFFLTGVDENAQKNVQAAEKAGIPVKEFIDKNAELFIELCKKLNLSHDDFIRTTAKEHTIVVQRIVKKIIEKGDIYKAKYEGLYCVGCETYYTENELIDGKCPEHNKIPELRKEDAYFFKLSKYKKELQKLIPQYVTPESKAHEVLNRVNGELNDICISRHKANWGIDFPNDKKFKVWVWIDALINYISGLKDKEEVYWPAQLHVVGKGINWFHSVIWPAMLISADYKLPEKLLVHGYLTTEGKKMSKSLGNVIDPLELLNKYHADSVRYSLLRCNVFDDSDFSEDIIIERHNNELANKLGNLVSRVSTLAEKYGIEKTKSNLEIDKTLKEVKEHFNNYELHKVLEVIFHYIDKTNEYIQEKKPWEVHSPQREAPQQSEEAHSKSKSNSRKVLYELSVAIKNATILLSPFIPSTAERIAKTFNFKISLDDLEKPLDVKSKINKSEILFQKI